MGLNFVVSMVTFSVPQTSNSSGDWLLLPYALSVAQNAGGLFSVYVFYL